MTRYEDGKRLVKKASKMLNPVEKFGCLPKDATTLDGEKLEFNLLWATHLRKAQEAWVFDLFDRNMHSLYAMSQWGWDETSKRQELSATTARFIIVSSKNEPVAFCHYRFDLDHGVPVLYCYEIQVEEKYQAKGIGTVLMNVIEELAKKTGMDKVMATVFAFNEKSLGFFHKLGYCSDATCPDAEQGLDYLILSKPVN